MRLFSFPHSSADNSELRFAAAKITADLDAFMKSMGRVMNEFVRVAEAFGQLTPADKEADARAWSFFVSHLSNNQQRTLKRSFIIVQGKQFKWRIETTYVGGNVFRLGRSGRRRARYCAEPDDLLPIGDVLLAQKMLLETNEDQFLAVANRMPIKYTP